MRTLLQILTGLFLVIPLAATAEVSRDDPVADAGMPAVSADMATALLFIRGSGANKSFPIMLKATAMGTVTMSDLIAAHGQAAVEKVVDEEVAAAVNTFGMQWDRNLATSYLQHVSAAEIQSLMDLRDQSPSFQKFRVAQQAIAQTMREMSSQLIGNVATDITLTTLRRMMAE